MAGLGPAIHDFAGAGQQGSRGWPAQGMSSGSPEGWPGGRSWRVNC